MARKIADYFAMTTAELEGELKAADAEFDARSREIITNELHRRLLKSLKEPHWTLTPAFWISLVAAVAACIAAIPVVKDWFSPPEPLRAPVDQQAKSETPKSPLPSPSSPAEQQPRDKR